MSSLKAKGAIFVLSSMFQFSFYASVTTSGIIRSPQVTDWGQWGDFDLCEHGMFVIGMKLKVEPSLGKWDDSSLNAIRFVCDYTEGQKDRLHLPYYITSKEGEWGHWGPTFVCQNSSYAVGFQLRSEPSQGGSRDDTAANNLRLFCSSGEILVENGLDWGDWTQRQNCGDGFALCGMQTQVEDSQGAGDDTGLNNLKMECCKVQDEGNL